MNAIARARYGSPVEALSAEERREVGQELIRRIFAEANKERDESFRERVAQKNAKKQPEAEKQQAAVPPSDQSAKAEATEAQGKSGQQEGATNIGGRSPLRETGAIPKTRVGDGTTTKPVPKKALIKESWESVIRKMNKLENVSPSLISR